MEDHMRMRAEALRLLEQIAGDRHVNIGAIRQTLEQVRDRADVLLTAFGAPRATDV